MARRAKQSAFSLDLTGGAGAVAVTAESRNAVHAAVRAIASQCDGAVDDDGVGFNGVNAKFGHTVAALPADALADDVVVAAYDMLRIYRRQLLSLGFDYDSIPRPPGAGLDSRASRETIHAVAVRGDQIVVVFGYNPALSDSLKDACPSARWLPSDKVWAVSPGDRDRIVAWARNNDFVVAGAVLALDVPADAPAPSVGVVRLTGAGLEVQLYSYNRKAVEALRMIPGRTFNGSAWVIDPRFVKPVMSVAARFGLAVDDSAAGLDGEDIVVHMSPTVAVAVDGPTLVIRPRSVIRASLTRKIGDALHRIERSSRWSRPDSGWVIPATRLSQVVDVLGHLGVAIENLDEVQRRLVAAEAALAEASALDADLPPIPGLNAELKPFQRAGVAYAVKYRQCFISDEVGLGKTIQAIATIEAAGAYPAVVFCPNSLRINWLRELNRFVPDRHVMVVSGTKPTSFGLLRPDVVICHYEVSRHWAAHLARELSPMAVVCDESHLLKEPTTYRTKAVMELAGRVPADGVKLNLTGTPVLNKRKEYASQLAVLGRLDEFGGAAAVGRTADIAERLRASGAMIRRRKKDVMPDLPPPEHKAVMLPGDPEVMEEYARAEEALLDYLAERASAQASSLGLDPDSAAMDARLRAGSAEHLVRIGVLKLIAARAKLPAAKEWVQNYLAGGDPLLLFAHNLEVLDDVESEFGCPVIRGGQSSVERMDIVDRFQDRQDRLVALGLSAGGVGLTLTAAKDVAFLQQGWTPAIHDQAIGRAHGRINDPHAADGHYLLCEGSIDLKIAALIDEKRREVDDAVDGPEEFDSEADEATSSQSILGDLVVSLTRDALNR